MIEIAIGRIDDDRAGLDRLVEGNFLAAIFFGDDFGIDRLDDEIFLRFLGRQFGGIIAAILRLSRLGAGAVMSSSGAGASAPGMVNSGSASGSSCAKAGKAGMKAAQPLNSSFRRDSRIS